MGTPDPLDFDLYVFDLGNVVIRDIETVEAIASRHGLAAKALQADYELYVQRLMEGTIDARCYWEHVEHRFGIRIPGDPFAELFNPRWNEPMVRLVNALRGKGKRVVVGSNTYAGHWEILRARRFLDIFDACYASHEMGIAKPAGQFFLHILAKEGVDPGRTFFIDDVPAHVDAAHAIGLHALRYEPFSAADPWFAPVFT